MTKEQDAHPTPANFNQKLHIMQKLLVLENARDQLEQELRALTDTAHEEVQQFLNSSSPTSFFSELTTSLDVKSHAVDKLSALLKDLTRGPQACVQHKGKNGVRRNRFQPFGDKEILISDVLKFGPMLQNSLMATSLTKAIQVLGATLSLQQLKQFISQPAAVQQDDMFCRISSSYNSTVVTASLSCHREPIEKETEEKRQPDAAFPTPIIVGGLKTNAEKPQLLFPIIQAIIPDVHAAERVDMAPVVRWGREDDVQVQHQKQTSSQLINFLKEKAKLTGVLEVTVMECCKSHTYASCLSPLPSPLTAGRRHCDYKADYGVSARHNTKSSLADTETPTPVFTVKCVESSGSLTYSCVIATRTELWDIGNIFVNVGNGGSKQPDCPSGTSQAENYSLKAQHETHSTPEQEKAVETNTLTIPEFQVRKFEETEVMVSHVVSPGDFYIQHVDSTTKLQPLVTNSWKASSSYAEQKCIPDIGTRVIGWFSKEEQWCRVQVTKICGVSEDKNAADGETSIKVEVKRLDHGDTTFLSLWNLRTMTPEMAALPLQAVQVSLANVVPVNGGDWSEEAVGWFKAMVHNRTLYARLYPQGPKITVELFLEEGKLGAMRRGASLSLRLVQHGHAKHSTMKNGSHMKESSVQVKVKKHNSEWEKYLISCYTCRK